MNADTLQVINALRAENRTLKRLLEEARTPKLTEQERNVQNAYRWQRSY